VKNNRKDAARAARNYAFLLLKFRPRSVRELRARMKKKKFNEATIKSTIAFLKEKRFLDDRDFSSAWIAYRLRKPLGFRRIELELRQKGIDKEIIREQIQATKKGYSEEDVVLRLARERLEKLRGLEPQKARERIYAYLLRRGFSHQTVTETVRQL
jgi:regulatory protein